MTFLRNLGKSPLLILGALGLLAGNVSGRSGTKGWSLGGDSFHDTLPWVVQQYDPASGGFFNSASGKQNPTEVRPDLESTLYALQIFEMTETIQYLPDDVEQGIRSFVKGCYVKELDGAADPGVRWQEQSMWALSRSLSAGKAIVSILDRLHPRARAGGDTGVPGKASAPPPGVPVAPKNFPHCRSVTRYRAWLKSLPLNKNPWKALDDISSASRIIKQQRPRLAAAMIRETRRYLLKRQDKETGLWGEGDAATRISGAFKALLIAKDLKFPLPNRYKVCRTTLKLRHRLQPIDISMVRNAAEVVILASGEEVGKRSRIISRWAARRLKRFKQGDGGFSRFVTGSLQWKDKLPLGKGLMEGDLNATVQAFLILKMYSKSRKQDIPRLISLREMAPRRSEWIGDLKEWVRGEQDEGWKRTFSLGRRWG